MNISCAPDSHAVDLLGVQIDQLSIAQLRRCVVQCVQTKTFCHIVTVNALCLWHAHQSATYRDTVNSCELCVPDGSGVSIFARILYGVSLVRYPGVELLYDLLKIANKHRYRVFFVCRDDGLSTYADVARVVSRQYPHIRHSGVDVDIAQNVLSLLPDLQTSDIVIANFGMPMQEVWLASLRKNTQSIVIGVGGSFDFLTQKISRAPRWMRVMGCEWLYRTLQRPHRARIMWRSVVIVPILLIREWVVRKLRKQN